MAVLQQFKNSASATLAADLTAGALSLTVATGSGVNFPTLTGSQFFYVTLFSYGSSRREIVKVTARATDTFTIVRAQDGTTASAFSMGDTIELRVIAADMTQIKTDIDTNTTNITANTSAIALKASTTYVDTANALKANNGNNTDITSLGSLTTINGGPIGGAVNYFINGGCQVAQSAAPNLSTTAQYGAVDNIMAWCSTGAVTAGTISQNTASGIGTIGTSLKLSGVTLTGSAVLSVRIRIESKDAVKLKNIASSVAVLVSHDVGAPVNYTVIVRKPTVVDNYTSTAVISTSSAISVPTGISSATWLKFENIAMGDCSNGIEVEFQIACGAITTKNFEFTEFQIGRGATAVAISLKDYGKEFADCQRLYRKIDYPHMVGISVAATTTVNRLGMQLFPPMRIAPVATMDALSIYDGSLVTTIAGITASYNTPSSVELDITTAVALSGGGRPAITINQNNATSLYLNSRL